MNAFPSAKDPAMVVRRPSRARITDTLTAVFTGSDRLRRADVLRLANHGPHTQSCHRVVHQDHFFGQHRYVGHRITYHDTRDTDQ